MLASDVARAVRTQLVHQIDQARVALPEVGAGLDALAGGTRRGFVDASLATSRLGRAVREATIAETMLRSTSRLHGEGSSMAPGLDATGGALELVRGRGGSPPSLESLVLRMRSALDRDPGAAAIAHEAAEARLGAIGRALDDAAERANRVPDDAAARTWIGSDGELHYFS